jgi:hypothetical protein
VECTLGIEPLAANLVIATALVRDLNDGHIWPARLELYHVTLLKTHVLLLANMTNVLLVVSARGLVGERTWRHRSLQVNVQFAFVHHQAVSPLAQASVEMSQHLAHV